VATFESVGKESKNIQEQIAELKRQQKELNKEKSLLVKGQQALKVYGAFKKAQSQDTYDKDINSQPFSDFVIDPAERRLFDSLVNRDKLEKEKRKAAIGAQRAAQ